MYKSSSLYEYMSYMGARRIFPGVGREGSEGLKSPSGVQGQSSVGCLGPQKLTAFSQNNA